MIINFAFLKSLVYFFYTHFERGYFSESNGMPHVKIHLTVTVKINKLKLDYWKVLL
jgi:hypothetical protein